MSQFKRVPPRKNMDETYELEAPNSIDSVIVKKMRPQRESPPLESESSYSDEMSEYQDVYAGSERYIMTTEFDMGPISKYPLYYSQSEDADLELEFAKFQPKMLPLETIFVPFLAGYEPAVGEPDPLVKPQRPDLEEDQLGITVIDEPAMRYSNATLFMAELQRTTYKTVVASQFQPELYTSAEQLHEFISKCEANFRHDQGNIVYSIPVPGDIILELWPPQLYNLINEIELPPPKIALSLAEYAQVCCLLLDIPIADNLVESLHMLFTNYQDVLSQTQFWRHQ